jgi:tetratricopeptide (TPR) repeat protein
MLNILGSAILHFHRVPLGEFPFDEFPFGEFPPPAPRDCFGRDELIEKVIRLAENLEPIALLGAGGIGKTSIALTVLHHNRIEQRFGENRRYIRFNQFPASRAHFLARLSKVIGAGVRKPGDLTPLRPFLSSKEMFIVLDNAEFILDPKGTNAKEIYSVVDELCQFPTISLCITSRITTVPPRCNRPEIPTLSVEAACDIFYRIYGGDRRSSIITNLLKRLDFHALSITLLATVASHNAWDYDQLVDEWNTQRVLLLQTEYNGGLAETIELSLSSPTFCSLGPNARDFLGVIAFFPQGVNEKNLDWLFPTISDRKNMFDTFCRLSLTYRSNGFVTMLSPIRDYLSPRDPRSSPLLSATRDRYFSRLSVDVDPKKPGFGETRWIVLEDVNVEHLIDAFTSVDEYTGDVWDACCHFMKHLYWHKPRYTTLTPKIEGLPGNHPHKPNCLSDLSRLIQQAGNHAEGKRLFIHTLRLERQRGDDFQVAQTLRHLSDVNRLLGLHEEGIQQTKEALEIFQRIGETNGQTRCLGDLAWLLFGDKQLDAAEEAASRALDLASEKDESYFVCQLHRVLGKISYSKGEKKKAVHRFETALVIASPFNWHEELFWIHCDLADLLCDEDEYDDATVHLQRAKSHAVDDAYRLAHAMHVQAAVWYLQSRLEEAKWEGLHALEIFGKLGVKGAEACRDLLKTIEREMKVRSCRPQGELPDTMPRPALVNFHSLAGSTRSSTA